MNQGLSFASLLVLDKNSEFEEPPGNSRTVAGERQRRLELVGDAERHEAVLDRQVAHLHRQRPGRQPLLDHLNQKT